MAIQETNLGHFDYIGLYHKDAILSISGGAVYNWKWRVPVSLDRRRAPSWFVSVVSCYLDDSNGAAAGQPHFLRMKTYSTNYHTYEEPVNTNSTNMINFPIVSILVRDAAVGHYYSLSQDNVVIQVPSNIQYIEFDIIDGLGNVLNIDSTNGESMNITLKVTYPERTEVMANTIQTYQKSMIGNTQTPNTF